MHGETGPRLRLAAGSAAEALALAPPPEPTAADGDGGAAPPRHRRLVPARDLRFKILSLLLLSALGPVLLVGAASYLTARSILGEKTTSQLDVQASWGVDRVERFLADRSSDVSVFAEANVVAENLGTWSWARRAEDGVAAAAAAARLTQYLKQIGDRYPLYGSLAVVDAEGRLAAAATSAVGDSGAIPAELAGSARASRLLLDERGARFAVARPVRTGEGDLLGSLVAVCRLDELWLELADGPYSGVDRLRVVDAGGRPLFDSRAAAGAAADPRGSRAPAWDLLRGHPTAEYRGEDGRTVLGALRFLDEQPAAILVETDRASAFATTYRLREFTLLVSVLATLLVAAVGFGLVVNLTRPIEALIAGAKAAARGDLSQEIAVTSNDQIGYLTRVFNHMIRTARDSRERLELLSSTDALTGLLNRRTLAARFEAELNRAARMGDPLSVLMIDIDRFKAFNDRQGHLAGDAVLHFLGDFLTRCLRSIDIAARYGGEEFLVLLPSTDKRSATDLAERLRSSFKRVHGATGDGETTVTLSVGVAGYPADGTDANELVCAADAALYDAKREGRDRVRVAASSPGAGLKAIAPAGCGSRP